MRAKAPELPWPHDELARLRAWKAEAMQVLGDWEQVWETAGCPGQLGESKAEAVRKLFAARIDRIDVDRCGLPPGFIIRDLR